MHRITPTWTWTHNSQNYTLDALNTYPRNTNFVQFCSTTSRFRDTRSSKIGNAPNDPTLNLTFKSTLYTLNTYPRCPNLVHFALQPAVFKIQGCRKTEMCRMTPNSTWTLNTQSYPVYTEYLYQRPKFWSVSLHDQRFPRHRTFYHSPLTPILNIKKNKNCHLYTTLVETLLRSMPEFVEQICCMLSDKMSFEVFSPIWPHVNENKQTNKQTKMAKIQNLKFRQSLYNFGRDPP